MGRGAEARRGAAQGLTRVVPMILAVTTATPRFSAALLRDDVIVARVEHEDEMRHAERFFASLDELFSAAGVARSELSALACDVGPGSFTGVRVGLSSCKGVALALGIPVIPVSSLEAMAAAAFARVEAAVTRVVVLDAKRGEVFYGGFDRDGEPAYATGFATAADAPDVLAEALTDEPTRLCGRAALGLAPDGRRVVDPSCDLPDASWIARLAARRLVDGSVPELALVEPVYLRDPDAKKPKGMPKLFTKA